MSHSFGKHAALRDVSFSVPRGCVYGLLGPNGSGKTTLFRLLSTLLPLQQGRLTVHGSSVSSESENVRQLIGVTFQSPALDVRLSVQENLRCHGSLYGLSGSAVKDRINSLLGAFDLTDRTGSLVGELSGGLRRRVELAKVLLHSPSLLLLDEPTSGLDPRARQEFWELLLSECRKRGTTVIVATHLMPEAELCDHLLLLNQGTVVVEGTPSMLRGRLSGDRLVIRVNDADRLRPVLEGMLSESCRQSGNQLAFRTEQPAAVIARLLLEHRQEILSLELAQPSLEDVFVELTGRRLTEPD